MNKNLVTLESFRIPNYLLVLLYLSYLLLMYYGNIGFLIFSYNLFQHMCIFHYQLKHLHPYFVTLYVDFDYVNDLHHEIHYEIINNYLFAFNYSLIQNSHFLIVDIFLYLLLYFLLLTF